MVQILALAAEVQNSAAGMDDLIHRFLCTLKSTLERGRNSGYSTRIVLIIESNWGGGIVAETIVASVKSAITETRVTDVQGFCCMHEPPGSRNFGVTTTEQTKTMGMTAFGDALERGAVAFHYAFGAVTPTLSEEGHIAKFCDQLRRFRTVTYKRIDSEGVLVLGTKYSGKVAGGHDDLVMAALLSAYYSALFRRGPHYSQWW